MANVSATHICAHNSAALLLAAVLPPHTHTHTHTHACAYESPVAFVYDCIAALNLRHGLYIYYVFVYMYIHKYAFVAVPCECCMPHRKQTDACEIQSAALAAYIHMYLCQLYMEVYTHISTHLRIVCLL